MQTPFEEINDREIIIMVGLPRSGKTTFCKKYLSDRVRISPDDIRLAIHGKPYIQSAEPLVWAIAETFARAAWIGGAKIVIDATNTTEKRRATWTALANDLRATYGFISMNVPIETCLDRAERDGNTKLMEIIEKMSGQYEHLPADESVYIYPEKGGNL
jgi:predicted kinase